MGEEERRRKAIIDSMRAMFRGGECMATSLVLFRDGRQLTDAMVDDFMAACEVVARKAAVIEKQCSSRREGDDG